MSCVLLCLCVRSAAKAAQPERALEVDPLEHGKHQEVRAQHQGTRTHPRHCMCCDMPNIHIQNTSAASRTVEVVDGAVMWWLTRCASDYRANIRLALRQGALLSKQGPLSMRRLLLTAYD